MSRWSGSGGRLYTISVIADMLGLHQQTLRIYEKRGLINPIRTAGKTRLYSEEDLETIRRIQRLRSEFGVNLAGIEIIFEMRERLIELQRERDQLRELVRQLMEQLWLMHQRQAEECDSLVPAGAARLIRRSSKPSP
jgi:MerR family transcriptional regulator/heat shock protein HspR